MKKTILYKLFEFIKKIFTVTMTFLVLNINSLECVSMNNQECKIRSEIMSLCSILSVLKQINAVEVVIILMIHMLDYVFQILLKT